MAFPSLSSFLRFCSFVRFFLSWFLYSLLSFFAPLLPLAALRCLSNAFRGLSNAFLVHSKGLVSFISLFAKRWSVVWNANCNGGRLAMHTQKWRNEERDGNGLSMHYDAFSPMHSQAFGPTHFQAFLKTYILESPTRWQSIFTEALTMHF